MRTISGTVLLPPDAPVATAGLILVEARDVSVLDAPSVVVTACEARGVALGPSLAIPFALDVPEAAPGRTLSLRAHVSLDGSAVVNHGDAVSTRHVPVPPEGNAPGIEIPVRMV